MFIVCEFENILEFKLMPFLQILLKLHCVILKNPLVSRSAVIQNI